MKKLSLIMVLVMLATALVAACGPSTKNPADTAASGEATPTPAVTTAPATEEPEGTSSADGEYTIGFAVSTLGNDFFVEMRDAAQAKADEMGVNLIVLDAQDSSESQATQMEDLITQKVDLIICNPVDSDAIGTSVVAANNANIPVITVTRPSKSGDVVQHLDIDNKEAGALDAEQMIKDLNGKGKIAVLEGISGAPSAVDRQEGFVKYLEENGPDIEVVTSLTANYSKDEGATVTEDILQSNPELHAIYAHNDEMALGAVRAIAAAGREGILVYGIDAVQEALAAIKDGKMAATVQQQPDLQIATALENAVKVLKGEEVEPLVNIPLKLLTADNVGETDNEADESKTEESGTVKLKPKDAGYVPAAQDVADQGYDFYDKAKTYEDVLNQLGPIPKTDKEYQLGFTCKAFENEFWRMIKDGSEDAVKELSDLGINITMDVKAAQGESDESGQLSIMTDMVNKGYDGILASPISDGNLLPAVERALENDIEMIVVNSTFMADIETTVGAWHWRAGEFAAQWINDAIGGEGEVAIITGMPKSNSARSRTDAFKAWFEENNSNVTIVDVQNGDWDRMKAKDITDTWMKSYPNLKGIYANNDTMAMGSIEAVISAGKLGECFVVGTDGTSEAIESIKEGELSATVNSYPYYLAKIGVEMLIRKLEGQEVPKVIYTPQVVIDKDNSGLSDDELVNWKGFNVE